jgi:asparagine synthetase B (glutamine-hydrolysing)
MFMVAVTRAPLETATFQGYTITSQACPSFTVSFLYNNKFTSYRANADETALTLGLTQQADSAGLSIRCSLKRRDGYHILSIRNPTVLGRYLYYSFNAEGEFFCSPRIGLLRAAGVRLQENPDVIPEFMVYRHATPPESLFANIKALPQGGTIKINIQHALTAKVHGSFAPDFIASGRRPFTDEAARETKSLLRASIENLRSSTPHYFLFSGGLDSSILFALGREHLAIRDAYSTSYPFEPETTNSEEKYALSAAKAFGANHHYLRSSNADFLFGFLEAIAEAELPVDHLQSVMIYLLFKHKMSDGSGVIVTGTGADSIFGTSTHSRVFEFTRRPGFYSLLRRSSLVWLMRAASGILGKGKARIDFIEKTRRIHSDYDDPDNLVWELSRYGSEKWVSAYYGVDRRKIIQNRLELVKAVPNAEVLDILSLLALTADSSAAQAIWASLAESTGHLLYFPYLDESLLKGVYAIRWEDKLREPKYVLRRIARDIHVPEFIITRKKSGFGANPSLWAPKGSLFEPLVGLCTSVFPEAEIRRFQSPEMSQAMTYWGMLNYALWKRMVLDAEPVRDLQEELRDRLRYAET